MSDTETSCLDYIMVCGFRGMKSDMMKQYYLDNGVEERLIDNSVNLLNKIENELEDWEWVI